MNSLHRNEKDSNLAQSCEGTGMFSGQARGEKVFCKSMMCTKAHSKKLQLIIPNWKVCESLQWFGLL